MNINHPLKYKYYTYRKPYLIYLILFIVFLLTSILSFRHLNNFYKYLSSSVLLITFLFTIINAVYEFTHLIAHYLSIKTIKLEYLLSSVIYSIINAFIQTILIFTSYLITKAYNPDINQIFTLNIFTVYSFTFIIHLLIFSMIGLLSLFLKKVKYVQILLYGVLLLIVSLISLEITNRIIDFVYNIYSKIDLLLKIIPIFIITTIITWILIYQKIRMTKK